LSSGLSRGFSNKRPQDDISAGFKEVCFAEPLIAAYFYEAASESITAKQNGGERIRELSLQLI